MPNARIVILTVLALTAFAGNSRLLVASAAVIGGIALVVLAGDREQAPTSPLQAEGADAPRP